MEQTLRTPNAGVLPGTERICACTNLRKAARAIARFYEEHLAAAGLTATQFAVLRTVERKGRILLSRLAEELVMDRTSLYRAMAPLLEHRWLRTGGDPLDKRALAVELTPSGMKKIRAALPCWEKAQKAFLAEFGRANWTGLLGGLTRAVASADRLNSRAPGRRTARHE